MHFKNHDSRTESSIPRTAVIHADAKFAKKNKELEHQKKITVLVDPSITLTSRFSSVISVRSVVKCFFQVNIYAPLTAPAAPLALRRAFTDLARQDDPSRSANGLIPT
jgi:hypothetical protein